MVYCLGHQGLATDDDDGDDDDYGDQNASGFLMLKMTMMVAKVIEIPKGGPMMIMPSILEQILRHMAFMIFS